jgi:hypothetical protein
MIHPTGLSYVFASLMAIVTLYCVARIVAAKYWGRRNHYDVNVSHVLMGIAMIGMLVPRWNKIPDHLWEALFGIIALWFLAQSIRVFKNSGFQRVGGPHVHGISQYLIHFVMASSMLYMYWLGMPASASSGSGMSMSMAGPPASAGDPSLTFLLIGILFVSAVWQLDSLPRFAPSQLAFSTVGVGTGVSSGDGNGNEGASNQQWLAPRLEVGCHVLMCLTMGFMLILMV